MIFFNWVYFYRFNNNQPLVRLGIVFLFIVLNCLPIILYGQNVDTIRLQNGYTLSGKLNRWTPARLNFSADSFGIIEIEAQRVEFVKVSGSRFWIETNHYRNIEVDFFEMRTDSIFYSINNAGVQVDTMSLKDINSILPVSSNIHSGSVALGHTYTLANQTGLINMDLNYSYATGKYGINLLSSGIYSLIDNSLVRNKENVNLTLLRTVGSGFSAGLLTTYDRNENQILLARYQVAIGAKYSLFNVNTLKINLVSGLLLSNERSNNQLIATGWAIPFQTNILITDPKNERWSVQLNQFLYSQTSFDRLRSESEFRGSLKFTKRVALSSYLYHVYDSRPLSPEASKGDYGWTLGVRVSL